MTKIINLYGGPCAGKSTLAAELFYNMKMRHMDVELVTEYAKDLVWEENTFKLQASLETQLSILSEQALRIKRLQGKVDYIITDAPLLVSVCHSKDEDKELITKICKELMGRQNNIHVFINRNDTIKYQELGRNVDEETAIRFGEEEDNILAEYCEDSCELVFAVDQGHKANSDLIIRWFCE